MSKNPGVTARVNNKSGTRVWVQVEVMESRLRGPKYKEVKV